MDASPGGAGQQRGHEGYADPADVLRIVSQLSAAVWAHAAIAAAVESGLVAAIARPASLTDAAGHAGVPEPLARCLVDVLSAVGLARWEGQQAVAVPALAASAVGARAGDVCAHLRSTRLQAAEFVQAARFGTLGCGWSSTDAELLVAQGSISAAGVDVIADHVVPGLPGLADGLRRPDAAFLDAGAGVAAMTIAFARRFPAVRCVALEPAEAPLAIARRNVEAAGLGGRIDVRGDLLEHLTDAAAYDLAWLAIMFMPTQGLELGLRCALRALRPGAWALTGAIASPGADLAASLSRLHAVRWGSDPLEAREVCAALRATGFVDIRVLPGPPTGGLTPIAARRPPDDIA